MLVKKWKFLVVALIVIAAILVYYQATHITLLDFSGSY